jgi:hypothetical protein
VPEIAVPKEIRASVIRELYKQVGSLDWDEIPARERTAYYTRWVEDPAIGGELADYYTAEGMRVWLKDGPLKEYARALEDFGLYAEYAMKRLSPASEFISDLLGVTWQIKPETTKDKPMHCLVTDGEAERYVCWGKPRVFRDLLWAAVNAALSAPVPPLIVVWLSQGETVGAPQRRHHERVARHCGLDLAYVDRRLEVRT